MSNIKSKRSVGFKYEKQACDYLKAKGYKVIKTNYYTRFGEIDIIAMDDQTYVFVEVKYRKSDITGRPYEAVDVTKQKRMMKTSVTYCKKHRLFNYCLRFDIIDILGDKINHYVNAFEMNPMYCQF